MARNKEKKQKPKKKGSKNITIGRPSKKDILLFTKNLSILLKSGSSIAEALSVLRNQAKGAWKEVLNDVTDRVETGHELGEALNRHPKVFTPIFRSIVAIGEQSGTLEDNLEYLGTHLEKNAELRRQVVSSMLYPVIILLGTVIVGTGVAMFVLPKLSELFSGFDVELPATTRLLLWIAEFFELYGLWAAPAIIGGTIGMLLFLRTKFVQPVTHWLILHIPIVKSISHHLNLAMFTRTLGILLQSGITIDRGLRTCEETVTNLYYKKFMRRAYAQVETGVALTTILREDEKLFPPTDVQIIQVGERSGSLSDSLNYSAEVHEKEVSALTKNLATSLEPIILLVLGLLVATLALSVITPLYSITDQFRA